MYEDKRLGDIDDPNVDKIKANVSPYGRGKIFTNLGKNYGLRIFDEPVKTKVSFSVATKFSAIYCQ